MAAVSHKHFFWVYAVLALGLGGYGWRLQQSAKAEEAKLDIWRTTVQGSIYHLARLNEQAMSQMNKTADAFPKPVNQTAVNCARQIVRCGARSENICSEFFSHYAAQPPEQFDRKQLHASLLALRDTLSLCVGQDSATALALSSLLPTRAATQRFVWPANPDTASLALWRDGQIWTIRLAQVIALNYLQTTMVADYPFVKDYTPLLSPERPGSAIAHQPFRAELSMAPYSASPFIFYFLDGEPLGKQGEMGVFSRQFSEPGVYDLWMKSEIVDPLSGTVKTYEKPHKLLVTRP